MMLGIMLGWAVFSTWLTVWGACAQQPESLGAFTKDEMAHESTSTVVPR